MKDRNQSHASFDTTTTFTKHLKAIAHVDSQYSEAYGEGLDTPMEARGNYRNDVLSMVRHFKSKIGDPFQTTTHNPFQGNGGVDLDKGDYRTRKPWEHIPNVAAGRSAPWGTSTAATWQKYMSDYIDNCMYKK